MKKLLLSIFLSQINYSYALNNKITDYLQGQLDEQNLAGLSVVVQRDDNILLELGVGHSDLKKKTPIDPNTTMLRWASISKTVTATLVSKAIELNLLDLDTDIRDYYPEYKVPHYYLNGSHLKIKKLDKKLRKITLRQLLSHTSGIPHYSNSYTLVTPPFFKTNSPLFNTGIKWAISYWDYAPLVNIPGELRNYSTPAYNLIGVILEKVFNDSFANIMAQYIFNKLDSSKAVPDYYFLNIENRSKGYILNPLNKSKLIKDRFAGDVSYKLPGGGIISTNKDLSNFCIGLIGEELISPSQKEEFWKSAYLNDGTKIGNGLGFYLKNTNYGKRISHSGSQRKSRTLMQAFPKDGICITLMTNTNHKNVNLAQIASYLRKQF